jgi:hypothetical protein
VSGRPAEDGAAAGIGRQAASPFRLFVILAVAFALVQYLHALAVLLWDAPFIDFAHYYTYATVVRLGQNPFDPQTVAHVDSMLNIRRAGAAANYPPLFYLLMQPWTALPFRPAAALWLLAMQACLGGALALCIRRFGSPASVGVAATLFVAFTFQPLIENLALGQVNPLLLLLVTLAWWGMRTERQWVAAASVALCPIIKVQYALLLPLLWWMGQRRVLGRALCLIGAGLAIGVALLGPAHHLEYLKYLFGPPEYLSAWTANLSPRATLARVLGDFGASWRLLDILTLSIDGAILAACGRAIPRTLPPASPSLDWSWALGVTAIPLLSPLTEEHHLVVLLFPLALLLLARPEANASATNGCVLLASVLLLGSRYSLERFPVFHQGIPSLLATGKLLGVAGLAWAVLDSVQRSRSAPTETV